MKFANSIKLLTSLLLGGVSLSALQAHCIVRSYGPLTESAKSANTGADASAAPTCYDINSSNCTATKSDGTLSACGATYSGPCTGSCSGACSSSYQSTWTAQAGTTVSGYNFSANAAGNTCGSVKSNSACTSIPNGGGGSGVSGAGCYCVGGTVTNTPCGTAYSLPANTVFPTCPAGTGAL